MFLDLYASWQLVLIILVKENNDAKLKLINQKANWTKQRYG